MNASHWEDLYTFAERSDAQFIFGVSFGLPEACTEGPDYSWNETNAATLLNYVSSHKQKIWGVELGNEINNNGPGTKCNLRVQSQAAAFLVFIYIYIYIYTYNPTRDFPK